MTRKEYTDATNQQCLSLQLNCMLLCTCSVVNCGLLILDGECNQKYFPCCSQGLVKQAVITMNDIVQVQPLKFKFPTACKCANIYQQ